MSRSLVLAFVIALILHVLLAGVELDILKGPLRVHNAHKALTVDLIKPIEVKKPSKAEKPPVIVKKPDKDVKKTSITKKPKPKPKPRATPTKKRENTEVPKKSPVHENEPPTKLETPAQPLLSEISREKEVKEVPEQEYAFAPDMVDIPTALPKKEDVPRAREEDRSPRTSRDERITLATPNYKKNSSPTYPLLARRRNYEGTVLLDVLVKKDGTVGSIRLARSSGHKTLDQSAIKGVSTWTFHPGRRGDEALEMWVAIPIRYQLK